jgi:hypothetical protein
MCVVGKEFNATRGAALKRCASTGPAKQDFHGSQTHLLLSRSPNSVFITIRTSQASRQRQPYSGHGDLKKGGKSCL